MDTKSNIIAVDFDGTIVEQRFPDVGPIVPYAMSTMHRIQDAGHRIILWTCRTGDNLKDAVNLLNDHGIRLHGINANAYDDEYGTGGIKAWAHLYIDDMALGAPLSSSLHQERWFIDWQRVEVDLEARGWI